MCANGIFSKLSLQVNAAELASLVESAQPVVNKLCLIAAIKESSGTLEEYRALRDWVDHAYVSLVELCELAANRVDFELDELEASSAPSHPQS